MHIVHRLIGLLSFALCIALLILAFLMMLAWIIFPATSPMN